MENLIILVLIIAVALLIYIIAKSKQEEFEQTCSNEDNISNQHTNALIHNKNESIKNHDECTAIHHVSENIKGAKTNSLKKTEQPKKSSSTITLPCQNKSESKSIAINKTNHVKKGCTGTQEKKKTNSLKALESAHINDNEANGQNSQVQHRTELIDTNDRVEERPNGRQKPVPISKPKIGEKAGVNFKHPEVMDAQPKIVQPYTIVSAPFLPDEFDIDYSTNVYFKYELSASKELKYPLVRTPQKGTAIKLPVHGRNGKRGFSEQTLCNVIKKYHLIHFYDNLTVFANGYPFEPDLAYIDVKKGIFIDIEVDEPYAGYEQKPIHYKINNSVTIDDCRNLHFTERGWIVLRFSEKQIVEQCESCLKYVYEVIRKMDNSIAIPESLACFSDLKEDDMWTENMAKQKIKDKEREKMLGISEFINGANKRQQTIISDYKNSQQIEDSVKYKKDEETWKSCSRQRKWQEYIDRYPHGKFTRQAKAEIDRSLWEECTIQKSYERYIKETKLGKFKAEAELLLSKQRQIAEENRRKEQERLKAVQNEEERKRKEALAEQQIRKEDERRKQEAERYERHNVTTVHPSPKTPSSRGYA